MNDLPTGTSAWMVQKADELRMAMALHIAADVGAVESVEGGEQAGRREFFALAEGLKNALWSLGGAPL